MRRVLLIVMLVLVAGRAEAQTFISDDRETWLKWFDDTAAYVCFACEDAA